MTPIIWAFAIFASIVILSYCALVASMWPEPDQHHDHNRSIEQ